MCPLRALRHVRTPGGRFLVQGEEVNGFTNGEEEELIDTQADGSVGNDLAANLLPASFEISLV